MATEAGFGYFKTFDFKDPSNLYYEVAEVTPSKGKGGGAGVSSVRAAAASACSIDLSATPAPAFCACHVGRIGDAKLTSHL